ncbi:hypothetical protein HDG35_007086 [Paraburkholderia sp. JPY681]|uniref:Uncharacterized protein n=1 Tax=Paraburkholderia atlantica TaxID=2654982 RepID=D5WNZ2_PARAM|nr:conserved hypothetical protein [Paraburkholderia atlantica]MBB5510789.1 hypothetical protein [Paraburkholderia atlantica]
MSLTKLIIRVGVYVCALLCSHAVLAGPVRCSVNNQDSTCVTQITTGWQTAPTCSSGPGYTTVSAAQWIGSKYSDPVCNYQAPPSCAPGWIQSGPDWNGSSWVNLGCTAPSPPPKTIVSITGFWVWGACETFTNGNKSGSMPTAVYQNNWSDGSTTYFQYWFGNQYPVLMDGQGRPYVTSIGDNWDTYADGNTWPLASLYAVAAGYPGASIPPQPAYACSGFNH